jgi:xanthine dehydrogenase YagT iron-sulfur-binding subunit
MDQPIITRRGVLEASSALAAASALPVAAFALPAAAQPRRTETPATTPSVPVKLIINGSERSFNVDPRTSLLDLLREHAGLTGSKKGCDHGQCGACTVLLEGRRINSCLSLAVMHDGEHVTTVEGLANGDELHPMQAAFLHHDGFQCGYCTPGQICSSIGMLAEAKAGMPSVVTADLTRTPTLDGAEIRERMSGNICRCSAYPNIVAAISEVAQA